MDHTGTECIVVLRVETESIVVQSKVSRVTVK